MAKGTSKRTERIQVYLIPQAAQDKPVLDVWNACAMQERPQEIFRAILRAGIHAMVESGDMPVGVVTKCKLEERLNVRAQSSATVAFTPPQPYYPQPPMPVYQPQPAPAAWADVIDQPVPEPRPAQREIPAPPPEPRREEPVLETVGAPEPARSGPPNTSDLLSLIGTKKRS